MGGGGNRRDEASVKIMTSNSYAALDALKKKKKSDKKYGSKDLLKKSDTKNAAIPEAFWAPAPITGKSWADVEDDDDDYFATTAPPAAWAAELKPAEESKNAAAAEAALEEILQDVDSEDDPFDGDDGMDDADEESELEQVTAAPDLQKSVAAPAPAPAKDTEKQLSKKELKKKELAELEALLSEYGYASNLSNAATEDNNGEKKQAEHLLGADRKDSTCALVESKAAKKKKLKKEKALKEAKEVQDQHNTVDSKSNGEEPGDVGDDVSAVDFKERIKKVAGMKKKSGREIDAAAKIAVSEAAARSARLAAAKKKEKKHYDQPVR